MAFSFQITGIRKLQRAKVALLQGNVLDGRVAAGLIAEIPYNGQWFAVETKGFVLDPAQPEAQRFKLTVDLRETGVSLLAVGDTLVYT